LVENIIAFGALIGLGEKTLQRLLERKTETEILLAEAKVLQTCSTKRLYFKTRFRYFIPIKIRTFTRDLYNIVGVTCEEQ